MEKINNKIKLTPINTSHLFFGGEVGVDAGIIFIGDPCYHLHKSINADKSYDKLPKAFGTDWSDFCDKTLKHSDNTIQFNYDMGHPGLGVLVQKFGGDGCYPVFVETDGCGMTKRIIIDFQCE